MTEPGGEPADLRLARPHPVRVLDGAVSYLDLRYATVTGWRPLTLDLHLPRNPDGPVPVVVYAHGGGFVGGGKEMGPWATLPARGIAVASVGYRLAGEVAHPGPVEDVLEAIRWVRDRGGEYGLDPGRIAGWGSSAGAYLVARAAFSDDVPLSALVLHYPVTDFGLLLSEASTVVEREALAKVVRTFLGVPAGLREDQLAAVSVVTAARRAGYRPPVHLSHGSGDRRCGLTQSRRLHEVVLAAGGRSELLVVPGADHADPVFATPAVVDPAVKFLRAAWARHDPLN
ncbi:alpha/beta hydrolase [Amycolatopsis sp. ATCC 39116]|uniref:alpha/beta hydrolase n=1 Tax=Amycolatopsis sp. (strain ATCC 39116 / 75iv2) TaxID=385957 RepID=UPI0002626512|nr:alpha/beta hydrolase [Amycolatopsis sp. ATCC 39116]